MLDLTVQGQDAAERLGEGILELATYRDETRPGWTRDVFSEAYRESRQWVSGRMAAAGLEVQVDTAGKAIFFMSADNCRFRQPVRPGDVVRMPVKVVRHRGDIFKFAGQCLVDGKVAAECEFAAMVVET